jgi:hypothetical protein
MRIYKTLIDYGDKAKKTKFHFIISNLSGELMYSYDIGSYFYDKEIFTYWKPIADLIFDRWMIEKVTGVPVPYGYDRLKELIYGSSDTEDIII